MLQKVIEYLFFKFYLALKLMKDSIPSNVKPELVDPLQMINLFHHCFQFVSKGLPISLLTLARNLI